MISVIIPLYNKAASIGQTLRTVLGQTFQDFEVVVVDDGSTDGGADVVRAVDDARIRLISQPNAGVSAARNRGVSEARGEFVAFLDADDLWRPTYLETQFALTCKYPNCAVFATNYEFHDAKGCVTPTILRRLPFTGEDGILSNYFEVASCSHPPLWTSAVIVRREAVEAIGGFPVGVTLGEDLLTWARLACHESIAFSRKVEANYIFRTQKQLVTPRRPPDKTDVVGQALGELCERHKAVKWLPEYVALWHKMRMVTFVRLGMRREASYEYARIRQYTRPEKKVIYWRILNALPRTVIRFLLFQIAKIR